MKFAAWRMVPAASVHLCGSGSRQTETGHEPNIRKSVWFLQTKLRFLQAQ
jgi:hypothetical protein